MVDFLSLNPDGDKALAEGDAVTIGVDAMLMTFTLGDGTVRALTADQLHVDGTFEFLIPIGKLKGSGTFDVAAQVTGGGCHIRIALDGTIGDNPITYQLDETVAASQARPGEPVKIETDEGTVTIDSRKGRIRFDLRKLSDKVPGLVFVEKS